MNFYNKLFLGIFSAFPPLTNHAILYDVCNVKLQLCAKGFVWLQGGKHFSKLFCISYMLSSNNRVFNPYVLIGTCPMRKAFFSDNPRAESTVFYIKDVIFFEFFLWPFFIGNPK